MTRRLGKCQLPKLLAERGMTQRQLAERVNLSPRQISDYVNDRRLMSLKNATLISEALHCHVEDLYIWVEIDK